jgi:hypothetical protein
MEPAIEEGAAPAGTDKAGGLLLAAFNDGATEELAWVDVTVGDLVVTVASDAMKAPLGGRAGVRLPVSYEEAVVICKQLECVAPSQPICDAVFAQARAQLCCVALVRVASDAGRMATVDFVLRFADAVEAQLTSAGASAGDLVFGAWKLWILHPRIVEKGAVNYGFWDTSRAPPAPVQTVGGQHDAAHYDYSQLLQPVKRMARRASTGEAVDLLDHFATQDRVPERYLDVYRADGASAIA